MCISFKSIQVKVLQNISHTQKDDASLDCGGISQILLLFHFKILLNVIYQITILKKENHMIVKIGGIKSFHEINNTFIIKTLS